jgi:hypothetical protein
VPTASAAVELVLVIAGSFLYWRAARRIVVAASPAEARRARLLATLVAAAGLATLALDVFVG